MPRACLTKSPAVALAGFAVAALAMPMAVFGQTLTVYGTAAGQSGPAYAGGTIAAGDTVRIDDGGSVTGAVSNSGTLQFNQTSGSISLTYTGGATATLSLTKSGTVALPQSSPTTIIDGAVNVQAGQLTTGTSEFGSTGTSSLSISGTGSVATTNVRFASGSGSVAVFTMSGGTFANTQSFYFASGTASSGTFTMTGGTASLGPQSTGGLAQGTNSAAVMNLTGGTCSWSYFDPAKGDTSTATITISGSARLNSSNLIRMSMGTSATSALTVNGGVVSSSQLRLGHGTNSASTFTVTSGSVGFSGIGTTTVGNLIGYGAGSSGTLTFTGGTTAFAGATTVGGVGPSFGGGGSRGMVKVEGGVITTNTASANLDNHFILGRNASTTGEMLVTGGTFTARQDFYVGGSGTGTLTLSGGGGRMQVGRLFVSSTVNSSMNNTGGAAAVTVSSGTLLVTGSGDAANLRVGTNSTGTGSLTINGSGVVIVGGTLTQGPVGGIILGPGGTLQIGTGTSNGGVLLGGTGSLLNNGTLVFNRRADFSYSGVISGSGAFVKRGTTSWGTLQAPNTYTGLTSVEEGVLFLSGSGSIGTGGLSLTGTARFDLTNLTSSTYTLPATGDLLGTGTISGSGKTLAVLGSFLPGSTTTGTISLASGLTLDLSASAGSTFTVTSPTFTAGTFDLVTGSGNVVLGGPLTLAFSNGPYADGANVVRLFTNTGLVSGTFTEVLATGLGAGQSAVFDATTGYVTIVPEPTWLAGIAAAVVLGAFMNRRCR
ncbi:MAG: beta strand repeat-containing protein [Planctomycetota bacterium]